MKTPDEIKRGLMHCSSRYDDKHDCDDCTYAANETCVEDICNDALAYINQLEGHFRDATKMVTSGPVLTWISVEEQLPECFKRVLVVRNGAKGPIVEQGFRDVGDWWRVYGTRTKKVRFWMPLPEPPKGA